MSYKNWRNCDYISTITKIDNILMSNGIIANAHFWEWNENAGVYKCTVSDMSGKRNSYGKGITPFACLASGKAEFIERVQGLFLFPQKDGIPFFADEFSENGINYLPTLNLLTGELGKTLAPSSANHYYSSNGFAAGNTYGEAMVHSICEIVEREAIYDFCYDNCVLKNLIIVNNDLKMAISQVSRQLDLDCYFIDITPYNIPVVLFIGISKSDDKKIVFKIQSGPSISIAVERCLTELFQLSGQMDDLFFTIADIPLDELTRQGIQKIALVGGVPNLVFPYVWYEFLLENINSLVSKKITDYSECENEDIIIRDFLHSYKDLLGNIYIRDYSWLGFPTIQIIFDNQRMFQKEEQDIEAVFYYCSMCCKYCPTKKMRNQIAETLDKFNFNIKTFIGETEKPNMIEHQDYYNFMFYDKSNSYPFIEDIMPDKVCTFSMDMNMFRQFVIKE